MFSKQKRIYFDNASATKIDPRVLKEIKKTSKMIFANPGSIHRDGVLAFESLEMARRGVAKDIGSLPDEIIFTSGATESNNLVIRGLSDYLSRTGIDLKDQHFISTEIEHPSVKEILRYLGTCGAKVDFLPVNKEGFFDFRELKAKITKQTVLVSLSYANGEIGVINDVKELMKTIRYFRKENKTVFPFVHLDASQGFLLDLNVQKFGIDFMVLDGQKMYGTKGSGILYKRRGTPLGAILYGGHQEGGLRAGTENVCSAVCFSKALNLAVKNRKRELKKISKLRDWLWEQIKENFPQAVLNGSLENRLVGNLNFSLPGQNRELLVLRLDAMGISISAGSACQKSEDSYVLKAITDDEKIIKSSVRVSLGRFNTKRECKRFIKVLKKILDITTHGGKS